LTSLPDPISSPLPETALIKFQPKSRRHLLERVAASIAAESNCGTADAQAHVNRTLSQIFRELVDVGEGRNAAKRRAPLSRLAATEISAKLVHNLVDARLLLTGRRAEPDTGDPFIEVAHEALLTNWPRVSAWIESVRDDLRLRSQLQRAAVEWREQNRPAAYSWSDERSVAAIALRTNGVGI
jgi:hypothetical protein